MMNKRGLSAIIATIIIIAITLIGIGIVMYVVMPLFTEGAQDVEYNNQCLKANLEISSIGTYASGVYPVVIKRGAGIGEVNVSGAVVIAIGSDGAELGRVESGEIKTLGTVSVSVPSSSTAETIEASAFVTKEDGTKHYCANPVSKKVA